MAKSKADAVKAVTTDVGSVVTADAPSVHETKIRVHRTVKLDGKDEESASDDETLEVTRFETAPAMAVVTVPIKISRNYQSVGVEVGVYLPCYKEELPQAIEYAYRLAKDRVSREIPLIQQSLQGIINVNNGQ